jgi:SAM-dependent methyltransferase
VTAPDLFDRRLRRQRRDRAASGFARHDFLRQAMLEGVADRLDAISRTFADRLDLGCFDGALPEEPGTRTARLDAGFAFARQAGGIQADEDRPPFADHSFDLVVSAGVLDSVNDLPGALTLVRRMLRPDGVFIGALLGGETLSTLRSLLLTAEGDRPAARTHPRVDVRSAGDLLVRAGFAMPVADIETLTVRYASLFTLLADLRGMGATSLLPRAPLSRRTLAAAAEAFAARADADGRLAERFDIVFLTGWAPAPGQPKPARRGSAATSLAAILKPPSGI